MNIWQRFGFYLGGFAIGIVFLVFFLSGKKTQCNYAPDARVLSNISKKERIQGHHFSLPVTKDSIYLRLMKKANVVFSKSIVDDGECNTYWIETENYSFEVVNCNKTATFQNLNKKNN